MPDDNPITSDDPPSKQESAQGNLEQRKKNLDTLKGAFENTSPPESVLGSDVDEDDSFVGIDTGEAQAELNDSTVSPRYSDLRSRMANEQGVVETTAKEAGKLIPETLLTLGEYAGYILDVQSYDDIFRGAQSVVTRMAGENPEQINVEDLDNSWSQLMRQGKKGLEKIAPTYRKDPGDVMDWDDPAFYIKNLQDLSSSVLAFWGVGAGVGAAARAGAGTIAKGINAGAKVSRALQKSSQVGTSMALSMSEGMGEAMQNYQNTYETALKKQIENGVPRPEAERIAKQAAGEMAATTSALNIGLITPLNYLSVSPIFRSMDDMKALTNAKLAPKGDELANPQKYISRLTNQGFDETLLQKYSPVLRESVFESLEEVSNVFAGGEGEVRAQQLIGEESDLSLSERIGEAFTSDEGRLSALLGAIGGSAQHLGIQRIPTQKTEEGFVSPAQLQAEAKVREYEKRKKSVIQRVKNFQQAQKDLAAAAEEGSEAKMEEARDALINNAMVESIMGGTEHHVGGMIDEMENLSEEEAEKRGFDTDPDSPTYYKKVAREYKKESKHLQKQWKRHQSDFNWGINEQDAAIPELLFRRYAGLRQLDRRQNKMERRTQEARDQISELPDVLGTEVNVEQEAHKLEDARLQALHRMLQNIDEADFKDGFESEEDLLEAAGFDEIWGEVAEAMPEINGLPDSADAAQFLRGRLKKDLKTYTQSMNGRPLSEVVSDLQSDLDNLSQPEGQTESLIPALGQKVIEAVHGNMSAKQDAKMLSREYDYLTSSEGRSEMVERFQEALEREENQRLQDIEETAREGDAEKIRDDLPDSDTEGKKRAENVAQEKKTKERKEAMGADADVEVAFDVEDRIAEKTGKKPADTSTEEDSDTGSDPTGPDPDPGDGGTPSPTPNPSDQPPKETFDPQEVVENEGPDPEPVFDPEEQVRRRADKTVSKIARGDEESTTPADRLQDQINQAAFNAEPIPNAEDSQEDWEGWERRRNAALNQVREDWLQDPLKNLPAEEVNRRIDNMLQRIEGFRKESLRDAARPESSNATQEPTNAGGSPEQMESPDTGTDPAKPQSPGHTIAYLSREYARDDDGNTQTASNERVSEDVKLAELAEYVKNGTRLTYEVQDEDITGNGDINESTINEAHIEVTAHLEDGTKVRVGALPEALFDKMRRRAIGGREEVERQLQDLRQIRETVLRAHVSSDIDTIRGRVIGKTGGQISVKFETDENGEVISGERDFRSIEEALDGDLQFAVAGDDGYYLQKNREANVKNEPGSLPPGTAGLIVPLSNGEKIMVPVWIPTLGETGLADTVASLLSRDFENDQRRNELSKFVFLRRGDARDIFFEKGASEDNIRIKVTDSGHIFIGRVNSGRIFTSEPNFQTTEGAFEGLYNANGEVRPEARELVEEMLMNVDLERINRDNLSGTFTHLKTAPDGSTREESYESYNEFLKSLLRTDLLEETVEGPDGETHYLYSEQPSIYHDVTLEEGSPDHNQYQDPMSTPGHEPSDSQPEEDSGEPTLADLTPDELAKVGAQALNAFDSRPQATYDEVAAILYELKKRYDETGNEEIREMGKNLHQKLEAVIAEKERDDEVNEEESEEAEESRTPINFDEMGEDSDEAPIASRDIDMEDLDSPVTQQAIKDEKDPRRDLEHMERLLDEGGEDYKTLLQILRDSYDLPNTYNSTQLISYLRNRIPNQESKEESQEESTTLSSEELNDVKNQMGSGMKGGPFSLAIEKTPAKTMTGEGRKTPVRETNMGESTYEEIVEELQSDGALRITCKR